MLQLLEEPVKDALLKGWHPAGFEATTAQSLDCALPYWCAAAAAIRFFKDKYMNVFSKSSPYRVFWQAETIFAITLFHPISHFNSILRHHV